MSISKLAFRGIKWSTGEVIFNTIIQFAQVSILARILKPSEFGLMAIAILVINFVNPIVDLGFSVAIIQNQKVTPKQLSSLYWLNIFLGVVMFFIIYNISPIIGSFYGEPESVSLIKLAALSFLITPWGTQYNALMLLNLALNWTAKISMLSLTLSFIVTIFLAFTGLGAKALVLGFLVNSGLLTIGRIIIGRRYHIPQLVFQLGSIKRLISFGTYKTGESIVNYFSANIDKILIGRFLGTYELGLYNIAWNLVLLPLRKINPIINKVAFPVFSKMQDNSNQINKYYSNGLTILMAINLPLLIGLAITSEDFIKVFYGEHWLAIKSVISILAITGLIKSFGNPGGILILAKGRVALGFYWNILWFFVIMISMYCMIHWFESLVSIAYAQLVAGVVFGWIWHWLVIKVAKVSYAFIFDQFFKILLFACLPMVLGVYLVETMTTLNPCLSLALKVFIGGLIYSLSIFLFFKRYIHSLYIKMMK